MLQPYCQWCQNFNCQCGLPAIASDCSAADGGAIGCGGEAGNPKRSADRRVTDLQSMSLKEFLLHRADVQDEYARRLREIVK